MLAVLILIVRYSRCFGEITFYIIIIFIISFVIAFVAARSFMAIEAFGR